MSRRAWLDGGRTVAFGTEQIFYRVDGVSDGDGPTLLFVHGFPTSSHDWAPVIEKLAHKYRCVSFDLLGFGASSKPRRRYSYPLQHEVLAQVVEAAGITRAVLVVHDYAVTLGQDFLAGTPPAPFALDGIIFLNGGLDPAQHRARPAQRLLASRVGPLLAGLLVNRRTLLRSLRAVVVRTDRLPEDDIWESVADHHGARVLPLLLHYIAERRARRDALLAALGSSVKKAFVWGLGDPVSGAHVLAAIRPRVGDALIRELAGVGHYPQLEAPDEVATFIDQTAEAWLK